MKAKIYRFLTKPYIVVLTMVVAPIFGLIDRNFVFFFGLGVALLILWGSNFDWSKFGIGKKLTRRTVFYSLLITAGLIIIDNCFSLLATHYFGEPNLSSLDDVKHSTLNFIIILIIVWSIVAFGEEILFRGYYMKWLAEYFGNGNKAWIASAIITSIYFGMSHYYQGLSGVSSITFLALFNSMIFFKNRNNLWILILTHGLHDTWGLTFLYLDKTDPILQWIQQIFI